MKPTSSALPDVVLIGAGIMSATLGIILKELEPEITIEIYERLDSIAAESSDAMNNAGTGHSAFCELNYTPEKADGSIDVSKAIKIAESFEISKQLWSYFVNKQYIKNPKAFVTKVPHLSFVWGNEDVTYLKKRYDALTKHSLFEGMTYTEDTNLMQQWMPLIMNGRNFNQAMAATRMDLGTDVNFGNLTRMMFEHLGAMKGVNLHLKHEVKNISRTKSGAWKVKVKDLNAGESRSVEAKFVFVGAGGGALPLLEKSGIPEIKGYGGFPVSGQWLICKNEEMIQNHGVKVYGKAEVGSPPMSVPHLDTRMINGKKALLFGPFAGFSTKFLKQGSYLDFPKSFNASNLIPILATGIHNVPLTKYLIQQVAQSFDDRIKDLRKYVPTAEAKDWVQQDAGQRVQVIKKDKEKGGKLEFGTEIVSAADGSIAGLLGASPGASTTVKIMLDLLKVCFKDKEKSEKWQYKLKEMIPSYGSDLAENKSMLQEIRNYTDKVLQLK